MKIQNIKKFNQNKFSNLKPKFKKPKNKNAYLKQVWNNSSVRRPQTTNDFPGRLYERLVLQKYDQLTQNAPDFVKNYKVIAGIVVTYDWDRNLTEVVAVATGSNFFDVSNYTTTGTKILDAHAEILAKRCLQRRFYDDLTNANGNSVTDFFVKNSSNKYEVKPGIRFHLYISSAPCGDGLIFQQHSAAKIQHMLPKGSFRYKGQECLTLRQEGDSRYFSNSCSAKIMRWNMLGIQGALLTNFIEPVYLSSIVVSQKYHYKNLYRAINGRIMSQAKFIPFERGYTFCTPDILHVNNSAATPTTESIHHCITWSQNDKSVEITDGTTGEIIGDFLEPLENKLSSRLSKEAFFYSFLRLLKQMDLEAYECGRKWSYNEVKNECLSYQGMHISFIAVCEMSNIGHWLKKENSNDFYCNYII